MSSQSRQLVKVIADIAIALEFTDENLINPDVAIELQENTAANFQALDEAEKEYIAGEFICISDL